MSARSFFFSTSIYQNDRWIGGGTADMARGDGDLYAMLWF